MSYEIGIFVAILTLAFLLFSREIFPLEISGLLVLVLLVYSGILDGTEALGSFGDASIILIGSLFVLISGLNKTGLIKKLEKQLLAIAGSSRWLTLGLIMLLVAFVSAFVSNTATLAVSIPIVVALAEKYGDSPRKWLMPVAFASVLGGMNTLIGTSTNIIISSLLPRYGIGQFDLFTTSTVGLPILALGIIFLIACSHYLLPGDDGSETSTIGLRYGLRPYTAEITVTEESPLCFETLSSCSLFKENGITVMGVLREATAEIQVPRGSLLILPNDRLIVKGEIETLRETLLAQGLEFHDEIKPPDEDNDTERTSKGEKREGYDFGFHEVLVTARSPLNNRTPREANLRGRYRLSLIAINRLGETVRSKLSEVPIVAGDILVVQFLTNIDNNLLDALGLVPLQELKSERARSHLAPFALLIFILSLLLGSITAYPLAITCLSGCVAMAMIGIIRPDEIFQAVEWRVLIFIGSVLCLGKGMEASGTATLLASYLSELFITLDPVYAVCFFFVITVVMTQLLSNQATAVVMIPIAINTATNIGLEPMAFIMSVTIAASCCFLTPFEPAFMLVYGPGRYRFADFFKLGIFLTIIAVAVALYIIPNEYLLM